MNSLMDYYHCGYLYKIKTAATVSIPASDTILTGLSGLQIGSHTPPPPKKKEKRKEYVGGGGVLGGMEGKVGGYD